MKLARFWRTMMLLGSGAMLLQAGGCSFSPVLQWLDTILLGTIAGATIWIVQLAK